MENQKAKQTAFRKLSYRNYFAEELRQVLLQEGFSCAVVDELIRQLSAQGYLNEQDNQESLIRKAIRQGRGPFWVKQQLRLKGTGIDPDFLEKHYPIALREEKIRGFLAKNHKKGRKAIGALERKGFALGEILRVYSHDFYS